MERELFVELPLQLIVLQHASEAPQKDCEGVGAEHGDLREECSDDQVVYT